MANPEAVANAESATTAGAPRPRRGRPKQEGLAERRREQIIESAYYVFAAKGYESTTISDVAKHAGVGQGTVYRYFDSKREILDQVFDYSAERFVSLIATDDLMAPVRSLADFADRLTQIATRMAGAIEREPELLRLIIVEASAADAELNARVLGLKSFLSEMIARILEDGIERGWIRPEIDTGTYGQYIIALVLPGLRHAVQGTLTADWKTRFTEQTVGILAAAMRVPGHSS